MYLVIGKDNCPQCDTLLNLLDEKCIRNYYIDQTAMPPNVITYLKMYSSTYPIVLEIKNQGSFANTLEYFANLGL
jgi:glutaredoxin